MRFTILIVLLGLALPFQAQADKPTAPEQIDGVTKVSAEETIRLILDQSGLVVIDSRKAEEFTKGHIEGAINLLDTAMTRKQLAQHVNSPQTPLLFYCNGVRCLRSSHAATKAKKWGYKTIYWFRGGWVEWREKQLPIAK
jgi:rhodanese-related sulfurtransferase